MFNTPREPGLANLLDQKADPKSFGLIHPSAFSNLFIIPSGTTAANCGELLLSPSFDALLEQAKRDFDFVIFDSIPVFASDDATTVAPKMDGVLFVVRAGFTSAAAVRQALDQLYQRQAKVLGLVLNRANTHDHAYPYYKYSEYYAHGAPDENPEPETRHKTKQSLLTQALAANPPTPTPRPGPRLPRSEH
jgi:Mrp family chromosome partitioning ATPase